MGSSAPATSLPWVGSVDRLPVRIGLQTDELLSSWFVRLAYAHGDKVQSLASRIWGRSHGLLHQSDMDRGGSWATMQRLAQVSRLPLQQLEAATLSSYDGWLFTSMARRGAVHWVMPVVDRLHRRLAFGQQVCPACLAEDKVPYLRKSWRLSLHCLCVEHRCLLLDRCAECQAPLLAHRGDVGNFVPPADAGPARCPRCRHDHRTSPAAAVSDDLTIAHQRQLLDALSQGWIWIAGMPLYSPLFFDGLWMLWSFLDAAAWSGMLSIQGPDARASKRYGGIDHLEPARRLSILCAAASFLTDWPDRLIEGMHAHRLSSYRLLHFSVKSPRAAPFWLWEPVHLYRDRSMYAPSAPEIQEVMRYVYQRTGRLRVADVCEALHFRTHSSVRIAKFCRAFSPLATPT
jgi:hypothetical protein